MYLDLPPYAKICFALSFSLTKKYRIANFVLHQFIVIDCEDLIAAHSICKNIGVVQIDSMNSQSGIFH